MVLIEVITLYKTNLYNKIDKCQVYSNCNAQEQIKHCWLHTATTRNNYTSATTTTITTQTAFMLLYALLSVYVCLNVLQFDSLKLHKVNELG